MLYHRTRPGTLTRYITLLCLHLSGCTEAALRAVAVPEALLNWMQLPIPRVTNPLSGGERHPVTAENRPQAALQHTLNILQSSYKVVCSLSLCIVHEKY